MKAQCENEAIHENETDGVPSHDVTFYDVIDDETSDDIMVQHTTVMTPCAALMMSPGPTQ